MKHVLIVYVFALVENVKEVLKLNVEQKGVVVPVGELTVYLDGLTVSDQEELAPLTNGNAANVTSEFSIVTVWGWVMGVLNFSCICKSESRRRLIIKQMVILF